ncbi:hypothetical protein FDUTEX481_01663 [Tolypothrix sp. PCC 7601]|nr:hypothetical protein FDUTEX481_01663 [Tolypothrix sp. PCC 7601]
MKPGNGIKTSLRSWHCDRNLNHVGDSILFLRARHCHALIVLGKC